MLSGPATTASAPGKIGADPYGASDACSCPGAGSAYAGAGSSPETGTASEADN